MIDWIIDKLSDNEATLLAAIGGSIVYVLISQEPLKRKIVGGASGFLSALIFSQPLSNLFSNGDGVHIYSAIIALCGQFIPQLIQSLVQKFSKLKLMDKLGLKDDSNSD